MMNTFMEDNSLGSHGPQALYGLRQDSVYSYIVQNLPTAPCSEASCETLFSIAKWIIGSRRQKMKLATLTFLLHIYYAKDRK